MTPYPTRNLQHHSGYLAALLAASVLLAVITWRAVSADAPQVALGMLVVFGVLLSGAAYEAVKTSVYLDPTHLSVYGIKRCQRIPRRDIEKVTWEKGGGVAVLTKGKKWIKIPHIIGYNSQSMSQIIRAWLKRGNTA